MDSGRIDCQHLLLRLRTTEKGNGLRSDNKSVNEA